MITCPGCGEENPAKFRLCGYCGAALAATPSLPAHEVRKTVTVVFSDLEGSTALGERLDAEALHEVKARYFEAMAAQISRHGGKVEKYIGDAIMAVFGLPRAHEDDALRAVRAAAGMRSALAVVNAELVERYGVTLSNRTGVNTGEVVASDDLGADQNLATGDAVNVAARLEQAARGNQILLGEATYRLVRDAVEVEALAPLALKGKAQAIAAWSLAGVHGEDGLARRHDRPLVGREAELQALQALYDEVRARRVVRSATVIGDAGVGKSRLVREVIDRVAVGARVLSGRCLPYGDGITFWPLLAMVREAADIGDADPPESALRKLGAVVDDVAVVERLGSLTGLDDGAFTLPEINWAARKFFEAAAARAPLVAFVDDIHWAEPVFLELLEHVQQTASSVPILILATARHELLDEHASWATQPGSLRLPLKPLGEAAARHLVRNLLDGAELPDDLVERIVCAAEGNPLYAEQMLSMLVDSGVLREDEAGGWRWDGRDREIEVPPSIHALLEARLDALARIERATVEPAAVIGLEFERSAVGSMVPEAVRATLPNQLRALGRKRFIQPVATDQDDPPFRFHHHLVRETVYGGLLKRARAQLHLAFVEWADRAHAARAIELEEVLGYHLEQAWRCLRELGPLDAHGAAVAIDAAGRLASAGRRANARGDVRAAANLLQRAAALLPEGDPQRARLLVDLGEALTGIGDFDGAAAALAQAERRAQETHDRRALASSRLAAMFTRLYRGEQQSDWSEATLRLTSDLIPELERADAHDELAVAWRLVVLVHGIAGRYSLADSAVGRAIAHARHAGNERLIARNGLILAINALHGPAPVPQAIAQCQRLLDDGLADRQVECNVMCALAQLEAMNGELDAARALYRKSRAQLKDLGQGVYAASTGIDLARVELQGGDLAMAEREVRGDYEFLAAKGETYFLSTMAALLARLIAEQGRDSEAMELTLVAERATAEDDLESGALWRMTRAPLLARARQHEAARALGLAAVELARRTEAPLLQADAWSQLAVVYRSAGAADDARAAIEEAIALYGAKGHKVARMRWAAWAAADAAR